MERLIRILSKEYSNLNQAALLLGLFAFLSQMLGLLRDRAFAHFIGPGSELDAYYAAFRVPDFIFISIASLFSVTVLVPFILEKINSKASDDDITKQNFEAEKLLGSALSAFLIMIFFVSALAFLIMPKLVHLVTPGFDEAAKSTVVALSRIMLLSPLFLGLSNIFGSVTQLYKKFFIYSISPIVYNLGIIFGIFVLYPRFGILGVASSVAIGAFLHFLVQFFATRFSSFKISIQKPKISEVSKVFMSSLPRTVGLASNSIAILFLISLASFLKEGSISVFNLSLGLQSVPLGIIGLSYAVAVFPILSSAYKTGDMQTFKISLTRAARAIIFWSVPLGFLFIVLRAQIVRVVLGTPSFSWESTRLVAASLAVFALSMFAQGMIALFARVYYASGNTKKPLFINMFSSACIIVFAFVYLKLYSTYPMLRDFIESLFRITDVAGAEMLMLPLAYSTGTILNFLLLWFFVRRDFMRDEVFIRDILFHSLGAGFIIGFVSYSALGYLALVFSVNTFWGIFMQGILSGLLGVCAGALMLYILGNKELKELILTLKSKFWRAKVLVPSQDEEL